MKLSSYCVVSILLLLGSLPAIALADDTDPASRAGLPLDQTASRGIITRDPSSIVKCKGEFWVFYTGRGIPSFHSKDLVKWEPGPPVFRTPPEWIAAAVPENRNMSYWAPDVIHLGDRYLLYCSVSSFGKITSAIGLATTPTLDPADAAYHWTDHGIVVQSREGGDFNTIDPAVFSDDNGPLWLAFGSYWSGIKLVELNPATGLRLATNSPIFALAWHESIEAAALYRHGDHYYLFLNWGQCCRGTNSTYEIRVGRSAAISGPYLDQAGKDMIRGGGSLLLKSSGDYVGPGHASVLRIGDADRLSYHYYDRRKRGRSMLDLLPIEWGTNGWPEIHARP